MYAVWFVASLAIAVVPVEAIKSFQDLYNRNERRGPVGSSGRDGGGGNPFETEIPSRQLRSGRLPSVRENSLTKRGESSHGWTNARRNGPQFQATLSEDDAEQQRLREDAERETQRYLQVQEQRLQQKFTVTDQAHWDELEQDRIAEEEKIVDELGVVQEICQDLKMLTAQHTETVECISDNLKTADDNVGAGAQQIAYCAKNKGRWKVPIFLGGVGAIAAGPVAAGVAGASLTVVGICSGLGLVTGGVLGRGVQQNANIVGRQLEANLKMLDVAQKIHESKATTRTDSSSEVQADAAEGQYGASSTSPGRRFGRLGARSSSPTSGMVNSRYGRARSSSPTTGMGNAEDMRRELLGDDYRERQNKELTNQEKRSMLYAMMEDRAGNIESTTASALDDMMIQGDIFEECARTGSWTTKKLKLSKKLQQQNGRGFFKVMGDGIANSFYAGDLSTSVLAPEQRQHYRTKVDSLDLREPERLTAEEEAAQKLKSPEAQRDDALDRVSLALDNTKALATGIQAEIQAQDGLVEEVGDTMEGNTAEVKRQTRRMFW